MNWLIWITGVILALAWFSRVVDAALGMPKLADIANPEWNRNPVTSTGNPRITLIVPARNEEADIEQTLRQLFALDYDNFEVIAVNDRSEDRTGEIMDRMAGDPQAKGLLRVLHIKQLPPHWLGKTHAMWSAAQQATGDWLLFTDADVRFKPDSVRRALAYAESEKADHLVLFPQIIMKTPGERTMIAFFQTLFVFGHRPWKVADPSTDDHIGVGAFNMIRRKVYEAVGTYKRLRLEVLDDMKLGKVVKEAGYRQRNAFGEDLISLRWARGALGVVNNLSKNFFAVLRFSVLRAVGGVVALTFLNLAPFVVIWLVRGWERLPYAVALLSILLIYAGMSWKSRIPPYYFLLHPVSTMLFAYTVLRSMYLALSQDGVTWRGTKYPLEELKRGLV
jgi:glycosyltransferase involved in cell wall biosynthesis